LENSLIKPQAREYVMKTDEPIAFVTGVKQFDPKMADTVLKVGTPLYTHPARTLTDGIDLLEKYADKLEDERPNKGLSDVVYECIEILRKAQEK